MQNPFTLTFGKSPLEPVERPVQTNEIVDAFTAESDVYYHRGTWFRENRDDDRDRQKITGERKLGSNRTQSFYGFVTGNAGKIK